MNDRACRDALVRLAHGLADHRQMAILGEGNVSARLSDKTFLVKASGTCMASLETDQLVEVVLPPLLDVIDSDRSLSDEENRALLKEVCVAADAPTPSVETLFHAFLLSLPEVRFVGHVHATAVNQILCSDQAESFAVRRLFPDQIVYCGSRSVLLPYVDPGLPLARALASAVRAFMRNTDRVPRTILIQNHGIIAVGSTDTEVMAALSMAEKAAQIFVGAKQVGQVVFMTEAAVERIDRRGDEKHRRRMLTDVARPEK